MDNPDKIITVIICPCCKTEDKPKKEYTKRDYVGNAVQVDEQDRAMRICSDCMLLYNWPSL